MLTFFFFNLFIYLFIFWFLTLIFFFWFFMSQIPYLFIYLWKRFAFKRVAVYFESLFCPPAEVKSSLLSQLRMLKRPCGYISQATALWWISRVCSFTSTRASWENSARIWSLRSGTIRDTEFVKMCTNLNHSVSSKFPSFLLSMVNWSPIRIGN